MFAVHIEAFGDLYMNVARVSPIEDVCRMLALDEGFDLRLCGALLFLQLWQDAVLLVHCTAVLLVHCTAVLLVHRTAVLIWQCIGCLWRVLAKRVLAKRVLAKRALAKQDFRPDFLDAITRGLPHLLRCVEVVRGGEEPGEEAHRDGDVLQEVDLRLGVEVLLYEERDEPFQARGVLLGSRCRVGRAHVVDPYAVCVCVCGNHHRIRFETFEFLCDVGARVEVAQHVVH